MENVFSIKASNGDMYIFEKSYIEYDGKKYPCYIHEGGDIIAIEDLWNDLKDDNDYPKDKDAEWVDDEIYLYLPKETFNNIELMVEEYIHS